MPRQIKPVEIKPGKLMSGLSADTAGIANYTVKRDFRRILERDVRAEGYEWFRPNAAFDKIIQSIPLAQANNIVVVTDSSGGILSGTYTLDPSTGIYFSQGNSYSISPPNNPPFTVSPGLWVIAAGRNTHAQSIQATSPTLISNAWTPLQGTSFTTVYGVGQNTTPISLISETQLGNGRIAIVAGTPTTLWRYVGLEDPDYYDSESSLDYFDTEGGQTYFADGPEGWMQIGSGFSPNGNRWEAVGVNGYLVLNNGVDLPMTYNLQESVVKPIYELREQGIACVGTIAAQDGILCCMDISQIDDTALLELMSPVAAAVNAAQDSTGTIMPAAATLFPSVPLNGLIGLTIFWSDGGTSLVSSVDTAGLLHTDASQPINDPAGNPPFTTGWTPSYAAPVKAAQAASLENPAAYALYNDADNIQRIAYRFFPSMPSQPRRFGSQIPVSMQAGSRIAKLLFPVRSIPELVASGVQSSFVITGVALGSGNLTANIVATTPGITQSVLLDATCMNEQDFGTTADFGNPLLNSAAMIEAADAAASFAGVFEDLEDDGGGIIKALTLQGQLVIYKETPVIFLAAYTGDLSTPFQFQRIPIQAEAAALRYRNTLIAGGGGFYGSYHFYAGKNAFFKFDMFTQTPVEIPVLQACSNIFFENASDIENAFCCENPLTREIYIVFPNNVNSSPDYAICYDVAYQSARTTSAPLTAAGKCRHPVTRDYWFVMGMSDGSLQRYGLFSGPKQTSGTVTGSLAAGAITSSSGFFTAAHVGMSVVFSDGTCVAVAEYLSPTNVTVYGDVSLSVSGLPFTVNPAIWHRDGASYPSEIRSGMDAFGLTHGEKMLNEYVLFLSSKSPNTPVAVTFLGGVNPAEGQIVRSTTIASPDFQNLVKPTVLSYYLGVDIIASGMNDPIEITGQLFNVLPVTSHSFGRRPIVPLVNCHAMPATPPAGYPPSPKLFATAVGPSQINLTWSFYQTGVTFNLYRSTSSSFTPGVDNVIAAGISGNTYQDTGLSSGVTYYYYVSVNVNA